MGASGRIIQRLINWWREDREWRRQHVEAWAEYRDPIEDGLSRFQQDCESRLATALAERGYHLIDRGVHGRDESYVRARIEGTDWTVWIYLDGAEVSSEKETVARLEEWDARTPEDLIDELIQRTAAAVDRVATKGEEPV